MNRRLLVDLEALAANYEVFCKASAGGSVGAVVKAGGYGIGAQAAAGRLRASGCRSFFVATIEEGLALKPALGAGDELFIFEGVDRWSAADTAAAGLIPVLNHEQQLEAWRPFARAPAAVHFDTGMSRLGFHPDAAAEIFSGFNLTLLLTHLACADEPSHPRNALQVERFTRIRKRFPGLRTSIGNSAGWLTGAALQGDLGRPGIGLFGGNPFTGLASPVRAVAALQGRILQVKTLSAGEGVGYGADCLLERSTRIGVVGIGYADGLPRHLSGPGSLAVNGRRCPILGRISMDTTVIDLGERSQAEVGGWAECFGSEIGLEELAGWAGTISYEVLTGIGARVARVFQPLAEAAG